MTVISRPGGSRDFLTKHGVLGVGEAGRYPFDILRDVWILEDYTALKAGMNDYHTDELRAYRLAFKCTLSSNMTMNFISPDYFFRLCS